MVSITLHRRQCYQLLDSKCSLWSFVRTFRDATHLHMYTDDDHDANDDAGATPSNNSSNVPMANGRWQQVNNMNRHPVLHLISPSLSLPTTGDHQPKALR
jgi:hypothetical protein